MVHKLNIHTGYSPVDISHFFAQVLNVETLSTSDAAFDYTIEFSTNIHRTPKIAIKNEPLEDNNDEILENNRVDVSENVEMETSFTDVLDIVKVETPQLSLTSEHTEMFESVDNELKKKTHQEYCCDICGATFTNYFNGIKEHMKIHKDSSSGPSQTSDTSIEPGKLSFILEFTILTIRITGQHRFCILKMCTKLSNGKQTTNTFFDWDLTALYISLLQLWRIVNTEYIVLSFSSCTKLQNNLNYNFLL